MNRVLIYAALCGAWCWCATPVAAERVVYAVAIGNNAPPASEPSLAALRYADDDAVRYYELFKRAGKHVALLTVLDDSTQRRHPAFRSVATAPTLAMLQRTLASFRAAMAGDRKRGDEPVIFLTFSGHGAVDEHGSYFLSLLDGGLTRQRLYDEILTPLSDTETHLIIDACNAEGVVGIRGPFDHEADGEVITLDEAETRGVVQLQSLARFPLAGAIVASSAGQETHEWSRIEAGVFTHELISALLGAADINGDLRIEYSEVHAFIAAANQQVADPRAVPDVLTHAPTGNPRAVLLDLAKLDDTVFLIGPAKELGRFSAVLPDGRRLVDVHVSGTGRVVVALPRRTGMYVQRGDQEAEIPYGSSQVSFAALHFQPMEASARGRLDRTLRDALFALAYSADYYRGFIDSHGTASVDFSVGPRALPTDPHVASSSTAAKPTDDASKGGLALPVSLLVISGVALVASATTLVMALDAKSEVEDTSLQRRARELNDRYRTLATISVAAAAVSATTGLCAFVAWPKDDAGVSAGATVFGRF